MIQSLLTFIKTTVSLCPTCLQRIPAEVVERDNQVWMDKTCPEHGACSALLASAMLHEAGEGESREPGDRWRRTGYPGEPRS